MPLTCFQTASHMQRAPRTVAAFPAAVLTYGRVSAAAPRRQHQPRFPAAPQAAAAERQAAAAAAPAEQQAAQQAAPGEVPRLDAELDDKLSMRPLDLDAAGYIIIKVDREAGELVADFYTNTINEKGLACDPATGEVISCKPGAVRQPTRSWRGRTAKALGVEIVEKDHGFQPVTHLEHALYLGRELQRAELALLTGQEYVQD